MIQIMEHSLVSVNTITITTITLTIIVISISIIQVMERSLTSARKVFIENLRSQMTSGEVQILDSWYYEMTMLSV